MTPSDYDAASAAWQRAQAEDAQDEAMDDTERKWTDAYYEALEREMLQRAYEDDGLEDAHFEDEL